MTDGKKVRTDGGQELFVPLLSIESELFNFLRFDSILGSETSLMNPHVRLSVVWLVDWSVGRSAGWSLGLSVLTFEKAYNFIIS